MNAGSVEITRLAGDGWAVNGAPVTVPEGRAPEAFVLAYAAEHYPPGTVVTLPASDGRTRRITLRQRPSKQAPAATAQVKPLAPAEATEQQDEEPDTEPEPRRTLGRRSVIAGVTALVALMGLAAVLILPRLSGAATEEKAPGWSQIWANEPAGGPVAPDAVQVAGAGIVLNIAGGAAEAYRQDNGEFIGSALAPESGRIAAGPDFMVLAAATEGSSSGAVITAEGIDPFDAEPGVLIRRGTVPFLAGGTGAEQYALIYQGGEWKKVDTPSPGLAPLALTESNLAWLGTGQTITLTDHEGGILSESVLEPPTDAVEATQRAFVTESLIGVVWSDAAGKRELVTHSSTTGKILEQSPAGEEIFDKTGQWITSHSESAPPRFWNLSGDKPEALSAGQCPAPIPAGNQKWCPAGEIYTADNGETLPANVLPIPSTTDTIPAVSGDQLALYGH